MRAAFILRGTRETTEAAPQAQAVLDGYLANPHLLIELRFWISNLEVMTGLISEHEAHAHALPQQVNGAMRPCACSRNSSVRSPGVPGWALSLIEVLGRPVGFDGFDCE